MLIYLEEPFTYLTKQSIIVVYFLYFSIVFTFSWGFQIFWFNYENTHLKMFHEILLYMQPCFSTMIINQEYHSTKSFHLYIKTVQAFPQTKKTYSSLSHGARPNKVAHGRWSLS